MLAWFVDMSRQLRKKWIIALVLPVTVWAQSSSPVRGLPEELLPELQPILRTALQRSPQMILSNISLAQNEANRFFSDAGLWPSISGSANYGISTASTSASGADSSTSSTGLSYSVNLGQPIFQWGALKYRSDIGRIGVKIAEKQYAEAYRILASTLRAQYLTLVYKRAAVRYAENSRKLSANSLALVEAKYKEGTISEGDLVSPRLMDAEGQLAGDRATADFVSTKRIFMRLAGMTELADETIPTDVPRPVHSPEAATALYQSFLKDGPGTTNQGEVFLMLIKQSDLSYRIAKTNLLPKFSLSANYGLQFSNNVNGGIVSQNAVTTRGYGVAANWTIFDGFATRGAKLSALASKRASERQLQSYAETLTDTVQSLREQLEFSARALKLGETRYDLARAGAGRVREDFKLGLVPQSAVDSANVNMAGADAAIISARADYLNRWSDFVSQTGADPAMTNLPVHYVRSIK